MTTFLEVFKNRGKILEGIKNSLFKTEHIEEIAQKRMEICQACPHIDKEGAKCFLAGTQPCCGLCGCSLGLKTRSLSSACDDKRWDAVMSEEEEDLLNSKLENNK